MTLVLRNESDFARENILAKTGMDFARDTE